jgi:exopolysaccharide biosynthesis polyprenyl glycosylphosphotransferase
MDLLLVNGALIAAMTLWGGFPLSVGAWLSALKWLATLSIVWLILGGALDVYHPPRTASVTQSVLSASLAALLSGLLYLAIPWLTPPLMRRTLAFGFVLLAVAGIAGWRALYAQVFQQPAFRQRALVVGGGETSQRLAQELTDAAADERANPFRGTGYQVVGFVGDEETANPSQPLIHLARSLGVDEILVAEETAVSPAVHEALLDCRELGLRVTPLSVAYERLTARLPVAYAQCSLRIIYGPLDSPYERLYRAGKRALDIVLALVGVVLVGLLSLLVALANALTSPGPLFYRQQRVGLGGRPFILFKFRTMMPGAERAVGAVWATDNDQRVTPIGRWLRRVALDELPQFINVLRGEMSLVGPRPERPQFVGELARLLPLYRARHSVRPGMTGWAYVHYRYGNSVEDARIKLEYDLYYIKHAGFSLDLLILLQTLPKMLQFKGY